MTESNGVWARAIHRREYAAILDWFTVYFFWSGVAILIIIDLVAGLGSNRPFESAARFGAGGLALAAAAAIAGWLLGLLFGIPRSLSSPQSAIVGQNLVAEKPDTADNHTTRPSRTNTNLEDVSDWLTKTIIGLGLANIYTIPKYLWKVSDKLSRQIFPNYDGGQSFVLLISIYFWIGGFWIGYVGTRTLVTFLFDSVDVGFEKAVEKSSDPKYLEFDAATGTIRPATGGLLDADKQLLSRPLQTLNSATELAAWGAAKARSGDWGAAAAILGEVARTSPGNAVIESLLSTVNKAKPQ